MSAALELADEYWAYFCATEQFWNIDRGDVEHIELWEDLSPAGMSERLRRLGAFAERADRLPVAQRSGVDAAMAAAVSCSARGTAARLPWVRDRALLTAPSSFAFFLSVFVPSYALVTAGHGSGYVAKLRGVGGFVEAWLTGVREGIASGRVPPTRSVTASIAEYDRLLSGDVIADRLLGQAPPTEIAAGEVAEWRGDVAAAVREVVRPAMARVRDFLVDEALPVARSDDEPGLCHLAGGLDAYAELLRAATTSALTAEAIHQVGLDQLARLDDEYRALGGSVLGTDDPAVMRARLRDDPTLRYSTPAEIIEDAGSALACAQAVSPQWFSRLPLAACTAVAVDGGPMAYYTGPSPDGNRGGTFFFNTSDPSAWTRCSLAATTFHESVPGHHLQLALANELDLHPVLGELEVTAYQEGWGLYAERLADEMGLYTSTLQRLGMLTLDSLRAGRLVVDTGLHALGWTRDQAIEFLHDHTAQSRSNVEGEIDRYIADPGQATSYMIGRLEIDRLRAHAADRLGERFSVRDFHDVVLGGGMCPLDELGHRVDDWIAGPDSGRDGSYST